jgi:3-dehydroquinate dehydratase/shikimate dehydrogenase
VSTRLVATLLAGNAEEAAPFLDDTLPGVDYVELRLDALARPSPRSVADLLALPRRTPVVATCRAPSQGGLAELDDETRLALLAAAGEAGAEVLDVEDTLLDQLPASVPGDRLASCHLSRFMPRLAALARRVAGRGARFAKLAVPAATPNHLAELLALQEDLGEDLALVTTGRLATAGRVMAAGRGAPLCYGALRADRPGHPDQPAAQSLHEDFSVALVSPTTRFLAVVGDPLGHSLSPKYHNAVLRGVASNTRMVPMEVGSLPDVLEVADALRLDGMAVTHPYKRDAMVLASAVLPGARSTGVANTLVRTPTGWQARNTDWKAGCDLMPRVLRAWRHGNVPPAEWLPTTVESAWKGTAGTGSRGKGDGRGTPKVLLLGAGGAARALAVSLFEQDVELAIWSRRLSNARQLASDLAEMLPAVAIPEPGHVPADILINATPVGMPGIDPFELAALGGLQFREGAVVIDLTYGGGESPIRDAAAAADVPVLDGGAFFGLQARRQAEVFCEGGASAELRREAARRCGLLA